MRQLSETTARQTIGMMRSIASHVPISPFHLQAAKDMDLLLQEVLKLRQVVQAQALRNVRQIAQGNEWVPLTNDDYAEIKERYDIHDWPYAVALKLKEKNT